MAPSGWPGYKFTAHLARPLGFVPSVSLRSGGTPSFLSALCFIPLLPRLFFSLFLSVHFALSSCIRDHSLRPASRILSFSCDWRKSAFRREGALAHFKSWKNLDNSIEKRKTTVSIRIHYGKDRDVSNSVTILTTIVNYKFIFDNSDT